MDEETRRHLLALAQMLAPHVEGCCAEDRWLVQCAVSELDRLCNGAAVDSPSASPVRPGEASFCPECEQMTTRRVDSRTETHIVLGYTITLPDVHVAVCDGCGKDVWDTVLDDDTLRRGYAMVRAIRAEEAKG